MAKKGLGLHQVGKEKLAIEKILGALKDGEWHRYQEIQRITGASSATISKHLKRLENGIVERKIDMESGEYPYPVSYRIRRINVWKNYLIKMKSEWIEKKQIPFYMRDLGFWLGGSILAILLMYFHNPRKLGKRFYQYVEHYIIPDTRDYIYSVRDTLEDMQSKGEDVVDLLDKAQDEYIADFKRFEKQVLRKSQKAEVK